MIGNSGEVLVEPIKVKHGDIDALGFKIDKMAYIPDISDFYHNSLSKLYNLDILIIDALRSESSSCSFSLRKYIKLDSRIKAQKSNSNKYA